MEQHAPQHASQEIAALKKRLAENDARLRTLIHQNADGILVIDAESIIRFCNPAAESLFDQPADQLIGRAFNFPLTVGVDLELHLVNIHTNQSLIAEMRVVDIEWEGAQAHLASLRDITARKLLDAERIEREKIGVASQKEREMRQLKDRFLTMMSHELRTPLALIQLSHDMLKQYGSRANDDERAQYLDNIHVQVDHLTEIIQNVLTISRVESSTPDFDPEVTDLVAHTRTIVDEYQKLYHDTHVIQFETPYHSLHAMLDRRKFRQALSHVLNNAVKYSRDHTSVHVALRADGRAAHLIVQDQGIGVPPDDLPHLTEPFHRGGNVETISGTGLGLTIVQGVVSAHQGTLHIESTLNHGTTVTLILPTIGSKY